MAEQPNIQDLSFPPQHQNQQPGIESQGNEDFCQQVVAQTIKEFGQLDILVNNAAEQHVQTSIQNISAAQLEIHL